MLNGGRKKKKKKRAPSNQIGQMSTFMSPQGLLLILTHCQGQGAGTDYDKKRWGRELYDVCEL